MAEIKQWKYPPVASRIKAWLNVGRFIRNPFPILDEAVERLGLTYAFYIGGFEKAMLTVDPQVIRLLLQKHHRAYEKSPIVTDILTKYLGHGLLTSTGNYWRSQRRLIQPGFHRKRIDALEKLMRIETDRCMERWTAKARSAEVFDAYHEMNTLTFSIVAHTLFSTSLEETGLNHLSHLISTLQNFIVREVRQPHMRWWFRVSGKTAHHIRLAGEARKIIFENIQRRRSSGEKPDDLLMMLLESVYEDNGLGMNDEQLIDECLIMFVAGHETSANALSWAIYLLGKYPEEMKKLREAHGEERSRRIHNIILETLRLYPPGWVVDRVSLEDDDILDYHIPAGTMWIIYIRGMHRHPDLWEMPDAFVPDRWSDPRLSRDAYMPFGLGPRMCIGEHFAMMEMQLVLEEIISRFEITLHRDDIIEKPLVTLRPSGPVLITLKRAVGL